MGSASQGHREKGLDAEVDPFGVDAQRHLDTHDGGDDGDDGDDLQDRDQNAKVKSPALAAGGQHVGHRGVVRDEVTDRGHQGPGQQPEPGEGHQPPDQ